MNGTTFNKTRIAPTPSGYLHLGNLYSFLLTAELARSHGAKILLRIDDMDRERADRKYIQDIFDTLNFMGINLDEGPRSGEEFEREYSQIHRIGQYREALEQLAAGGHVFACECSRSQVAAASADGSYPGTCRYKHIPLDADNVCWRLVTGDSDVRVNTLNDGQVTAKLPAEMRDFIVRKKDGFPAYQLSSVIDDLYYGIDLVVRGEDLWASTLAQLYLSALLPGNNFKDVVFHHHHLLTDAKGEKLSKTAGAVSIQYLRNGGKSKEEILEMVGIK
jgi:glutamyl-tRNA synthetase